MRRDFQEKIINKENVELNIPETELRFVFSRSGGAGGQNVNKVETKVTVFWRFDNSEILTDEEKELIREKLRNRINHNGEVLVSSQEERNQLANKERALQILYELVGGALVVLPERKPTRISRSAKEKRLEEKKKRSEKKLQRSSFNDF